MVECFFSQLSLGVLEDCFRKWCCGEGNAVHCLRHWLLETFFVAEEDGDVTRLGGPAVGLVDWLSRHGTRRMEIVQPGFRDRERSLWMLGG